MFGKANINASLNYYKMYFIRLLFFYNIFKTLLRLSTYLSTASFESVHV